MKSWLESKTTPVLAIVPLPVRKRRKKGIKPECDCGAPATHDTPSGPECDRCKELNRQAVELHDRYRITRFSDQSWEERRRERAAYVHRYMKEWRRRHRT